MHYLSVWLLFSLSHLVVFYYIQYFIPFPIRISLWIWYCLWFKFLLMFITWRTPIPSIINLIWFSFKSFSSVSLSHYASMRYVNFLFWILKFWFSVSDRAYLLYSCSDSIIKFVSYLSLIHLSKASSIIILISLSH